MAIVFDSDAGTITGLSVGGLPDGIVDAGTLATDSVDSAELIDGAVDDSHIGALAASKLTGALPAISGASLTGITTGKILQVVSDNLTTVVTSSTSWGDITGLSVSITPTAATSTFLVMLEIGSLSHTASSAKDMMVRIMRDSTAIGVGTTGTGGLAATGNHSSEAGMWNAMSGSVIDSPNTTNAVTYKGQGWANNGTWSINTRGSGTTGNITHSSITVMEIGA